MPVKVKVYIQGHDAFLDPRVNIDMELPAVPRVGECLNLTHEETYELERQAKASLKTAYCYQEWCEMKNWKGREDFSENDMVRLNFDMAFIVGYVYFSSANDFVQVMLSNEDYMEDWSRRR